VAARLARWVTERLRCSPRFAQLGHFLKRVDALGNLVRFLLLPGQAHDMKGVGRPL
jgi:hypothetical protein